MPKLLIFDVFTLLIREKNVANYALLRCKTFSLKIWQFWTNIMSDLSISSIIIITTIVFCANQRPRSNWRTKVCPAFQLEASWGILIL